MLFQDLPILQVGNTIQLAGAIYSGEGKTFLCFFPDERQDLPIEILEMTPDEWKVFLRQTDLLETEMLQKAKDGALTKAIVRKSQRQIDSHLQWRVFRRDGLRCRYCSKDDVPLTVDHLVLYEALGPTVESNLVASCRSCNKRRGNTPYAEWLQHPYYLKVSAALSPEGRDANVALVATLDSIERQRNVRSR